MRCGFRGLAVLAGLLLGAQAAYAADTAPYVTPMHDADIDYVMVGPNGQPPHQLVRWGAKLWRQRVDPEWAATDLTPVGAAKSVYPGGPRFIYTY